MWVLVLQDVVGSISNQRKGDLGRLPASFLFALTEDKLHAFSYKDLDAGVRVEEEIAAFERNEVWFRRYAAGCELFYLCATQGRRTRQLDLDGKPVATNPGAAEVIAALSR